MHLKLCLQALGSIAHLEMLSILFAQRTIRTDESKQNKTKPFKIEKQPSMSPKQMKNTGARELSSTIVEHLQGLGNQQQEQVQE